METAGMPGAHLNTSGTPRLTKFYTFLCQFSQTLMQKIFSPISDERWRIVYRNYATLHFVFVVDGGESELGILDLIQVFVEGLDWHFENVCELDLAFHFDEVKIIQGGIVLETNGDEISNSAGPRSGSLQTPLGWLTDKLAGVPTR
ncbi:hypothetical protein BDR04DRAFT_1131148 [Suillus decipiens]|nr:hypothetical protein BDR04DRAFT_1131148 [Suillus decipiens]